MSTINDGGPAFPVVSEIMGHCSGMSLRDRFAIAGIEPGILGLREKGDLGPKQLATFCYRFADAMLAARQKGGA